MSVSADYLKSWEQLGVVENLTEALEGISSYRIRQVKDRVLLSKAFFRELWSIYQGLRVEREDWTERKRLPRDLNIVLTSSAGLTGDIDGSIIQSFMADYQPATADVVSIGARGAGLLRARDVTPIKTFDQPDITKPIDTSAIVAMMLKYRRTFVYYQEFESLTVQRVGKMELLLEAQALGKEDMTKIDDDNLIIAAEYLFEPTQEDVVQYLEHVMLNVALTQMILESQLAQFGARFTAMIAANDRAKQARAATYLRYQSSRRQERDETAHEIIYALKGMGAV